MIWHLIPAPVKGAFAAVLAAVVAAFALIRYGRRKQRQETALQATERAARAHQDRRDIEDDIHEDADLVRRARGAGIVRPDDPA